MSPRESFESFWRRFRGWEELPEDDLPDGTVEERSKTVTTTKRETVGGVSKVVTTVTKITTRTLGCPEPKKAAE